MQFLLFHFSFHFYCVRSNRFSGLCTREFLRKKRRFVHQGNRALYPCLRSIHRGIVRTHPLFGPYTREIGRTLCTNTPWCTDR